MDEVEAEQETAAGGGAVVGRHLSKRSRKNKGLVVVFDADARKEFVTGFHKRKKKRRKLAEKQKQLKDREKHLQERKERRLALAEAVAQAVTQNAAEAGSEELVSDENDCDKAGGVDNGTVMYEDDVTMTVVNTYSIDMNADDVAAHNHVETGKAFTSLATKKTSLQASLAVRKPPQTKQKPSGKKWKHSSVRKGKHGSKRKKRR